MVMVWPGCTPGGHVTFIMAAAGANASGTPAPTGTASGMAAPTGTACALARLAGDGVTGVTCVTKAGRGQVYNRAILTNRKLWE